jgi:hypothetical protein
MLKAPDPDTGRRDRMPMVPLHTRLGSLALKEIRTITIPNPGCAVPVGQYGLFELYCNEPGCDCRRVLIQVISSPPRSRVWATISFGWEPPEFYRREGLDDTLLNGPFLDPLGQQTEYAEWFLSTFREMCEFDPAYVSRLAEHYRRFREAGEAYARRSTAARAPARPDPAPKRAAPVPPVRPAEPEDVAPNKPAASGGATKRSTGRRPKRRR